MVKNDIMLKQGYDKHGKQEQVCIECENDSQTISQDFRVTQLKSPCLDSLKSVGLTKKSIEFGDKTTIATVTKDIIVNTKGSECQVKSCMLKETGCKNKYTGSVLEISDDVIKFKQGVKEKKGQQEVVCVECTNDVDTE